MEDFILDILARIRELERALAANELEDIVRAHNQGVRENKSHISKRRALPFFLKVRESDPQRWASWNISPNEDALLLQTLRMNPRRTASGVATITVITKPWLCSGTCIYCRKAICTTSLHANVQNATASTPTFRCHRVFARSRAWGM